MVGNFSSKIERNTFSEKSASGKSRGLQPLHPFLALLLCHHYCCCHLLSGIGIMFVLCDVHNTASQNLVLRRSSLTKPRLLERQPTVPQWAEFTSQFTFRRFHWKRSQQRWADPSGRNENLSVNIQYIQHLHIFKLHENFSIFTSG